jgi:HSP20 family protein
MAESVTKLPVKSEEKTTERSSAMQAWRPFESLRREMYRLFDDFDRDFWGVPSRRSMFNIEPFSRRDLMSGATPAVDVAETPHAYEITAELPGMDEKNIEVKLVNGSLTIKGEKKEEREEKSKDLYVNERHFGSFERCFAVPEGVDMNKVEASFKKGVLTVTLPKKAEAQKPEKRIEVKAA